MGRSLVNAVLHFLHARARIVMAALALATLAGAPLAAQAQALAEWNPSGTVQSSTPLAPSSVAANVSAGTLALGPEISDPGPFANAFMGTNWPSTAFNAGAYMSFSTTGNLTYTAVVFSLYNNFDGTGNWELRSSADSFASALAAGTFSTISGAGQFISADVSALGTINGTVQFRLYTYNNAGTTNPLQRGIRGTGGGGSGLAVLGVANGGGPPVIAPGIPVPALGVPMLWALMALVGLAAVLGRRRSAG